uniref:hypothetical protein n=1 Tax=Cupriavidus taiwanensis TaxID=164546 RepID=UPI003F494123
MFARYWMRASFVRHACRILTQPLPALKQGADRLDGEPRLGHQLMGDEGLAMACTVTSQKRVRIYGGRRIVLGFDCGFVEAMVLNPVPEQTSCPRNFRGRDGRLAR